MSMDFIEDIKKISKYFVEWTSMEIQQKLLVNVDF